MRPCGPGSPSPICTATHACANCGSRPRSRSVRASTSASFTTWSLRRGCCRPACSNVLCWKNWLVDIQILPELPRHRVPAVPDHPRVRKPGDDAVRDRPHRCVGEEELVHLAVEAVALRAVRHSLCLFLKRGSRPPGGRRLG